MFIWGGEAGLALWEGREGGEGVRSIGGKACPRRGVRVRRGP